MISIMPIAGPSKHRIECSCLCRSISRGFSSSAILEKSSRRPRALHKPMWARRSPFLPFIDAGGLYKSYAPITPGMRRLKRPNHPHLHRGAAIYALTIPKKKITGRNHTGKIVTRGRGGQTKRRIRLVDTRRREEGPQEVVRIEFDPNRSGHIALIRNRGSGMLSYILAVEGLRAGDVVQSWATGLDVNMAVDAALSTSGASQPDEAAKARVTEDASSMPTELATTIALSNLHANGNCLQLKDLPIGLPICNIALHPGKGGQLCRSAGTSGVIMAFEHEPSPWAHVRLSSGEVRRVDKTCVATIGKVSNLTWSGYNRGKAGRRRHLGWRPKVAARAMNAFDHPLGGSGRNTRNKQPMSRSGVHAKGTKTRRPVWTRGNRQVVQTRPFQKKFLPRKLPSKYTARGRPSVSANVNLAAEGSLF